MSEAALVNPFEKQKDVPDFSRKDRSLEDNTFTMDGDIFQHRVSLPGGVVLAMAKVADGGENDNISEQVEIVTGFLQKALLPASYTRFIERLNDVENPIELDQVMNVFQHLIEKFTEGSERPTQAASPSLGGPLPTGPTSPVPFPSSPGLTFGGPPSIEF